MELKLKKMNRKGVFFTILTIAILSLFIISYLIYTSSESQDSVEKRINTLSSFVSATEVDLDRKMYISGFRSIFIFERTIVETGNYVNVSAGFNELFFNGTLNGVAQSLTDDAKFSDVQESVRQNGNEMNVNVTLANPKVQISQDDPWRVKITLISDFTAQDIGNVVSWNKTLTTVAYIPIDNFEDPVYFVSTAGKVINKINKTIYQPFSPINVANLTNHLQGSFYIASNKAPSFLDRLQGNLTGNSAQGIESLVNLETLTSQGIPARQKSCVDYIYFSSQNPPSNKVTGMPSWFWVDVAHQGDYNVTGLVIP